ncbi:MAG: DNA polymerase III subunit chi [Methylibium sp. NZG]|nr:MAG: DNA polymerase III subunit chi [Methylibium sp. NZG]
MTEVSFHFNVPDRLLYACRLLRKATRKGARVTVAAPPATLEQLDRVLWTFDPIEFLPHLRVPPGGAVTPRLRDTPVWLVETTADAGHHEVLLNLGSQPPIGFESFARVIEIVATDEQERSTGRDRWKHYAGRGYAIQRHEVSD